MHYLKTPTSVVRHTSKVLYGAATVNEPHPTSWLPVSFTVDSEAEFLVIRESRVALDDSKAPFGKIVQFENVS